MWRLLKGRNVVLCGLFSNFVPEVVSYEKYKEARGLHIEDPWERVKCIFRENDHGESHPEWVRAVQFGQMGLGVGIMFGGAINSAKKTTEFVRNNDANVYMNKRQALKAVANHNFVSFLTGCFRYAPSFGLFLFSFSLISSCCEAYRNESSVIDSAVAGTIVGSFSRFRFGIKGMISGGIVGGVLGTFLGILIWGLTKATGTNTLQLKYAQYALMDYRKQQVDRFWAGGRKDAALENSVHSKHVKNPIDELDCDKNETVNNKENKN